MFSANFIIADRISIQNRASSKKRVLEEVGRLLSTSGPGLTQDAVFDKLLERERLGSTGLGHGIALPHARMSGVSEPFGTLIQLQNGVDFDAIDQQPVDLAFGLLVPEEATDEHLQLLARLATLFSNTSFCQLLRECTDGEAITRLILTHNGAAAT
ncbi:MAG: PTS sugar transporter subunit IIA [Gammaproteobacteria bacterium]|nr:PTS sugar transporter subunit IIA [Gammaproteobacteria bacterium]